MTKQNEMIYNALTTKVTKEPKYRKEIEEMGYKIYDGVDDSYYNYYTITNTSTNQSLVISQYGNGKKGLFKTYSLVNNAEGNNIKNVDFVGFLNKIKYDNQLKYPSNTKEKIRILNSRKFDVEYYNNKINKLVKEKEKLENEIDRYMVEYSKSLEALSNQRVEFGLNKFI